MSRENTGEQLRICVAKEREEEAEIWRRAGVIQFGDLPMVEVARDNGFVPKSDKEKACPSECPGVIPAKILGSELLAKAIGLRGECPLKDAIDES